LVILPSLLFTAHPRRNQPRNQSSIRPDSPDIPNLERRNALRITLDLEILGEGAIMLHAVDIVPQIGMVDSKSGIAIVS